MTPFTEGLQKQLVLLADSDKAVQMKAYMKNQFEYLGIQTPARRAVCKEYIKQNKPEDEEELNVITKELWLMPEREYQYCAIELLASSKGIWSAKIINLFEYCITEKSWWDTVDFIAAECTGPYFKKFPNEIAAITGQWNYSDNTWLQRSSLLFQKSYKTTTNTKLLSQYILHLAGSREFFIQKAIGWMLREYAKTNIEWVRNFVLEHQSILAPLSKREALKRSREE